MSAYLTVAEFKLETSMPDEAIDELEALRPGFLDRQLAGASAHVDARLRKRYEVPFAAPVPETVRRWVAILVTRAAFKKRGIDPNDAIWQDVTEEAKAALEEIVEAANAVDGLFDLPLRADTTATGIAKGGPLAYSEASPYVHIDRQRRAGREEDLAGEGSGDG